MIVEQNALVSILLVDDDEDCRMLVRDAMKQGQIVNGVYEASSGEEALEFLYRRGRHAGLLEAEFRQDRDGEIARRAKRGLLGSQTK